MPEIVLINPETQEAQSFDQAGAAKAIESGFHVPLNDAQGNPFSAPFKEASELVQSGSHFQPNANQLKYLLDKTHYESAEQQAATFIEGALEPNTFGTYGKIATGLGITTPEAIQSRQEFNPGVHALGEGAGLVAGLALAPESSIPGLIGKAGKAASGAIKAEGFFGKAAKLATQNAIESGLFSATHEISENLLGDPSATAENMIANIGINTALGGGLGIALSPLAVGAEKVLDLGRGYLGREIPALDKVIEGEASMASLIPHTGLNATERDGVLKGLSQLKPNAKEIEGAAATIGAPVLESQISSSKFVQDLDSSMINNGSSWTAIKRQQLAQEGFNAVNRAVDESLGAEIGMTKAEVGETLKKGLSDAIQEETQPINDIYNRVKELGVQIPVEEKALSKAAKDMTNIDGLMSSKGEAISKSSPGYQLAKRVEEELPKLGTVDDVRLYAQRIGQDTIGKPELKYVASQIQNKLNDLIENSTLNAAKSTLADADALIEQHAIAKKAYGALRDEIDELGGVLGKKLRKGEGPQAFVEWLNDSTPEKIADKLFTKNNSKFLEFLDQRFPEESQLLKTLKKSQFKEAAFQDGHIVPSKVLKEVDKLEPEIRKFLFNKEELNKLKAAQTYLDAMPKNVNPSGTAKTLQLFDYLKNPIAFGAQQASDFLKEKFIKNLVRENPGQASIINALVHMANATAKVGRGIEKHSGAIFSKAATTIGDSNKKKEKDRAVANEPLKMHKLGTMVKNYMVNPEGLLNHMSAGLVPIADHAPNTSQAVMASMSGAVQFLASKLPQEDRGAPLDATPVPSNVEIAKFNRYAEVVEDPLSVLTRVKDGTVTMQDLDTLTSVYPSMYNNMKAQVLEKLTDYVAKNGPAGIPYKTRLGLSMFLTENLDSSTLPQNIFSNQMMLTANAMQQQQQAMQQMSPSKSGMGKMKSYQNEMTAGQSAASRHSQMRSV